jgi:hypothetical protein
LALDMLALTLRGPAREAPSNVRKPGVLPGPRHAARPVEQTATRLSSILFDGLFVAARGQIGFSLQLASARRLIGLLLKPRYASREQVEHVATIRQSDGHFPRRTNSGEAENLRANAMSDQLEALKTLYEGHQGAVKTLGERSFTTTLQAIGFDVAVVAGIVVGKIDLSWLYRLVATVFVAAFTFLVASYLYAKAKAHDGERQRLRDIESPLSTMAAIAPPATASWRASFWGGNGIFILLVALAGAAAILWILTYAPQ